MPHLTERIILRAWRHTGEVGRIHYMVVYPDGRERHLHVEEGTALYDVLNSHLLAQGYEGPRPGRRAD